MRRLLQLVLLLERYMQSERRTMITDTGLIIIAILVIFLGTPSVLAWAMHFTTALV